jgi:hypothetical protein
MKVAFSASSLTFAGNNTALVKSRNSEQGQNLSPNQLILKGPAALFSCLQSAFSKLVTGRLQRRYDALLWAASG